MNKTQTILLIIVLAIIAFIGLKISIERSEYSECLKWQRESKQYQDYYLLEWQLGQCKTYGIEI